MTRHIAIYMRVSTRRQDTASQKPDLERWASAFAESDEVVPYEDHASGASMDRPAWNKLERDLRAGKIKTLVVWRLDRLGRTAAGLTTLFEELNRLKVNLVSVRDGIDLSTPAGRLMANVLASVAAYENEVRSERIRAGQAAARASGKSWGGSKKGRRVKVTDEQITTIHRMAQDGDTKAAMARATGLSRPTIYAILSDGEASEESSSRSIEDTAPTPQYPVWAPS